MTQDEEQEYFERKLYFQTQYEGYGIDWSIGNLDVHWYGTQADYDKELKKYEAKGLKLWTLRKQENKPWDYDNWIKHGVCIVVDEDEQKRRRVFNQTQRKEMAKRQARYQYLKSSFK